MNDRNEFAGFWRRFLALIIDWNLVALALFPFILLGGLVYPDKVCVDVPYGIFTEETVLDTSQETITHVNGSVSVVDKSLVEETVLGRWIYLYEKTEEKIANHTESSVHLVDWVTREPIDLIDSSDFLLLILLVYWTISETGRYRASLGKRIMGIEVIDVGGATITWRRALCRNLGKCLSAFVFLVGFMMAGWTNRKQTLHDMLASCLVRKR
ncbi:RDD family protein [Puniceicoccaceae bacterium]|nr:RDD family protein [Puniceicoccaceae bacterium]